MTHAIRARKERGAKIVAIDIYRNATMEQADLALCSATGNGRSARLRHDARAVPRGLADREFHRTIHRRARRTRGASAARTPEWASAITGFRSRRSRNSPGSSASANVRSSASATAFRAAATARPTCTRLLHRRGDRRLGARGRRRLPQQWRDLPSRHQPDRRARRRRPLGARARPVPHRRDSHGRGRRAEGRPAGHGHADPEHHPPRRARPEQVLLAAFRAKTCSSPCTSSS